MAHILIADDDIELCVMLREYLEPEGFRVDLVHDGEIAAKQVGQSSYDVVVLDVMMPRMNGFDTLRLIRQTSSVPILMLTARGDDVDRIVGLEMGADDYLPKPCNPRELVARIRAILRRTNTSASNKPADILEAELAVGALRLNPAARTAEWQGHPLDLTSTEYNLLEVLARKAGHVVSKTELSEQGLGRTLARYDRSIDMHVSKLRRKLGITPDGRSPIQTVRGMGYQLVKE